MPLSDPVTALKGVGASRSAQFAKLGIETLEDLILEQDKKELYEAYACCLKPQEQTVVKLRYGLFGTKPRTQREIAKQLGISRSYVSRIEKRALKKLAEQLKTG